RTRRSGGDRDSAGLSLGGGEHGAQQPREARVDVLAAQRDVPVRALGARVRQPRLAQHLEVMRARGLRETQLERPARALALRGERAHDRDARGVAQGGHHGRQRQVLGAGLIGMHVRRSSYYVLRWTPMFDSNRTFNVIPSLVAALSWGAMFPIAASALHR